MTGHVREELGAYVLGALEPAEAEAISAHLETCAECRAERDRLAALPPLLDLVSDAAADDPATLAPPEPLEATVLRGFRERPPAPRRRFGLAGRLPRPAIAALGAAAGVALTMLVLTLAGTFEDEPAEPAEHVVALSGPGGRAEATVAFRPRGARVRLRGDELAPTGPREVYELWFVGPRGRVSAGTFKVADDGWVDLYFYAAADREHYDRIGITREPDALDPARNGPRVLGGGLPS